MFQLSKSLLLSCVKNYIFLAVTMLLIFSLNTFGQVSYRRFLLMGQMELSKENYVAAINRFNTAIQSDNEGFEAWFLRGVAKYSLGDYQGAVNDFTKTVTFHPLYTRAYLYRGICYDRISKFNNALADFNKALSLDPFDIDVYSARGETKINIHDFAGAVNDFSAALQLKHNNPFILLNRGVANHLNKNEKAALNDLQKSITLNKYYPDAYIKRGMIYYELDSLQKSLIDYNSAIALNANNPFTYFQRALSYLKLKDTAAVLNDYAKVLALDSTNSLTYYNRALIETSQKHYISAASDFNKVTALNPNNLYAWFNKGILYMDMKSWHDAAQDFTRVISIFPGFVAAYINRAVAKMKQGDKKGAFNDRKHANQIIAFVNSGQENAETLYRKYADSAYFRKIIRFEADFLSGDMKHGKIQFNRIHIAPFPDIQVVLFNPATTANKKSIRFYFDELIVRFNADNHVGIKLAFSTNTGQLPDNINTYEIKKLNENILNTNDTAGYCFIKGILYYRLHKVEQSVKCYDSTLSLNHTFVYALLNRGATQFDIDNIKWSKLQYSSTIGITKTGFHSQTKNTILPPAHTKALADYNQLAKLYPKLPYVYYNRANLKTGLRKFQRAIDDFSMAIRLQPHLAEAYYNRALVLLYLDETKLACKDLSKAGELGISKAYNVIKRYCSK